MKSITESGMKKEFRQTKQKKWSRFKVQESFSESEYGDECEVNVVWGNSGIDDGAMAGKALIQ
jgi:hypothetical protein